MFSCSAAIIKLEGATTMWILLPGCVLGLISVALVVISVHGDGIELTGVLDEV